MNNRYEIRDDQWESIRHLLPAERKPQGGRTPKDNRMIVNAMMIWIARSGAPWRDLTASAGSWKTVYTRFRRWQLAGIWDTVLKEVSMQPDDEHVMIDATLGRFHQAIGRSRRGITTTINSCGSRWSGLSPSVCADERAML
ncbi:transposase [Paenibacillus campi]|uniref:transposase n=1 Tax=Paenibacillus campi TaxID=3106031 RepID=UPI003A4C660B